MKKNKLLCLFLVLVLSLSLFPAAQAGLVDDMEVNATAALLVEAGTGEILYEQNAHEKRYPASITKVMSVLLVLEAVEAGNLDVQKTVTVSAAAVANMPPDGSTQDIKAGEQITVKDLMFCAIVASANEACNILAEEMAGSKEAFVTLMNEKAQALGMEDTHFANPHGLHEENHYTTAYDIYLMASEAMKYPLFREMVSTVDYCVPATNLHEQRHFYNTNALLTSWKYIGYTYRSAIGIKTGSTEAAGQCLVSAAEKDGRILYAVVLGAENVLNAEKKIVDRPSFSESKRLLEWGFENFSRQTILTTMDLQGEVGVTLSKTEQVVAVPSGALEATLPKDVKLDDFIVTSSYDAASVQAPVTKGQKLGTVTVTYEGKEYGRMDLVALNDVYRDEWMYRMYQIQTFFGQPWVRIALAALVVLFLLAAVWRLLRRRRQSYRRRSYRGRRR